MLDFSSAVAVLGSAVIVIIGFASGYGLGLFSARRRNSSKTEDEEKTPSNKTGENPIPALVREILDLRLLFLSPDQALDNETSDLLALEIAQRYANLYFTLAEWGDHPLVPSPEILARQAWVWARLSGQKARRPEKGSPREYLKRLLAKLEENEVGRLEDEIESTDLQAELEEKQRLQITGPLLTTLETGEEHLLKANQPFAVRYEQEAVFGDDGPFRFDFNFPDESSLWAEFEELTSEEVPIGFVLSLGDDESFYRASVVISNRLVKERLTEKIRGEENWQIIFLEDASGPEKVFTSVAGRLKIDFTLVSAHCDDEGPFRELTLRLTPEISDAADEQAENT